MKNLILLFFTLYCSNSYCQFFESNTIYEILLQYQFEKEEKIVVDHKTKFEEYFVGNFNWIQKNFKDLKEETFQDFVEINKKNETLRIQSSKEIMYIKKGKTEFIFRDDQGWDRFYKKYGKVQGIITLSKVGFDRGRTQALVYIGNQRGWLDGVGYLVYFELIDKEWKIIKMHELWIS